MEANVRSLLAELGSRNHGSSSDFVALAFFSVWRVCRLLASLPAGQE
jgi:hypothetical protein